MRRRLVAGVLGALLATAASGCTAVTHVSAPPPPVPLFTQEELVVEFTTCMQGKGWEMESDPEEGSSSPKSVIMDGQPHDYASDADACSALGSQSTYADYSRDERRGIYANLLGSRDCLIGLGFEIDDGPGFEHFDASDAEWTPLSDVPHSQFSEAEEICPPPFF
ncbi:hypothetical protein QCD70_13925 [Agreia sp. PsM10]|uniref:hypothetical protein n=1 Tax=Agreia sp. PsM10 TaxID=3030533 RepID=UPI00263B188B|nr:hypothetical protein [Agreia sp. PsM10]MDN4641351.1 hypothetical protein [Agreia sp. PsM10]